MHPHAHGMPTAVRLHILNSFRLTSVDVFIKIATVLDRNPGSEFEILSNHGILRRFLQRKPGLINQTYCAWMMQ